MVCLAVGLLHTVVIFVYVEGHTFSKVCSYMKFWLISISFSKDEKANPWDIVDHVDEYDD